MGSYMCPKRSEPIIQSYVLDPGFIMNKSNRIIFYSVLGQRTKHADAEYTKETEATGRASV